MDVDRPDALPLERSGLWLGAAFFALALLIALGTPGIDVPQAETPAFDRGRLAVAAPRRRMSQARVEIGGFSRACMECHRLFQSRPETAPRIFQHQHIQLRHGLNARCFNCHDERDRERLRLHGTQTVGFDASERLCAGCHGPTFRDWERGTHGRTMDSWRADARRRLSCVDCHDPHQPALRPIAPLPGPNTLRMGDQSVPLPVHDSPLMPWLQAGNRATHAPGGPSHE